MFYRLHLFPGLFLLILGLGLQFQITLWISKRFHRRIALLVADASTILLCMGYLLIFFRVNRHFSSWWTSWIQGSAIIWVGCLVGLFLGMLVWRNLPEFQTPRRRFLQAAGLGLCAAPLAGIGFGILRRSQFRISEVKVPIPNLPKDFDGFRIVQVTDIHLSPFLSEPEFARAVDMANETRAQLALVTGDLISRPGDPLDACLRQLARLRADAGVLGCMGNHEVYTGTEDYVAAQGRRIGIEFLRNQARVMRLGGAAINFA